jgi:hypothetical protein
MTEFNNAHTSLDDVRVGDHVAFLSSYDKLWTVATVTGETKTMLAIGNERYMRRSGYRHGDRSSWHKDRIEPLGAGGRTTYADLIRDGAVERAEQQRRGTALDTIGSVSWRKMSTNVLEQIAAIIKAEQKAKDATK